VGHGQPDPFRAVIDTHKAHRHSVKDPGANAGLASRDPVDFCTLRIMRRLAAISVVLGSVTAGARCTHATPAPFADHGKLVILGFDGMDPTLVQRFMADGQLPNIARLAHAGSFLPLGTTVS